MHWIRHFLLMLLFLPVPASVAAPPETPTSADISVNNVFLHDLASQKKVLGANIEFVEQTNTHPMAVFASNDGREFLTVFTHEGGQGDIAEFRIAYLANAKHPITPLTEIRGFTTGKGIYLGLAQSQVISILGLPLHQYSKGKLVTLEYRIEDVELKESKFLTYYNMPIYYGIYKFKNNRLVSLQFGFEYP